MPAPLLPTTPLDLTGLDRSQMLVRLQQLFTQLNPGHTDYTPAFAENLVLEGMVILADTNRATIENRARQTSWASVRNRLAAIRLGGMSNFRLMGASASVVDGVFTAQTAETIAGAVEVPAGTPIRTTDPADSKRYQTVARVVKLAGQTTVAVQAEHSESIEEVITSSGEADQEYVLSHGQYIEGTAEIEDTGGAYQIVTTFVGANTDGAPIVASSKVAMILVNDKGYLVVRFGNGIMGAIPQGQIVICCKVGGGTDGAVSGGAAWILEASLFTTDGQLALLTFSNPTAALPGTDQMTVEQARVLGPLSFRTTNRAINEDDFEYAAITTPGIARAAMVTSNHADEIEENHDRLLVVGLGSRLASGRYEVASSVPTAKLGEVTAKIARTGTIKALMGTIVEVAEGAFQEIDHSVYFYKLANYTVATVKANILAAIADFFAVALDTKTPNPQIDFGFKLRNANSTSDYLISWSLIYNAICAATGVRKLADGGNGLLLNTAASSVLLAPLSFPKPGVIRYFDMDQGGLEV